MNTLTIIDILIIFIVFCIVWVGTNVFWKIVEGKMLIKRQNEMIDALYAKAVRIVLKGIGDFKDIKEVINCDKM